MLELLLPELKAMPMYLTMTYYCKPPMKVWQRRQAQLRGESFSRFLQRFPDFGVNTA
jgi:hypothetical protein